MGFVVGVDLGTTFTGVAVRRDSGSGQMVSLGRQRQVMPSVVWLGEEAGDYVVGEIAVRRLGTDAAGVVRLFKRRVGVDAPILVRGREIHVEELVAAVLEHVVGVASSEFGGTPDLVALTFPASWGPYRQGVLVAGASLAGIESPFLVTEPKATAAFYAAERDVPEGSLIAVFDFGGGTLDIAVVHRVAGGFELLGTPVRDRDLGGASIDELLFDFVSRRVESSGVRLGEMSPEVLAGIERVRRS